MNIINQKRGRLRSRIRSWSVLSQRPKWRPTQSYTTLAGPNTTPDAAPHRQLHHLRYLERNNETETIKSNEHAVPLADRPSLQKTI
jgi:hypothetical protein